MIRTKAKYVSAMDFFTFWGKDLNAELKENENTSNKVNIFLMQVEDMILSWIDANSFRRFEWDDMTEFQLDCLQKAILTQAMYEYRNTDLSLDSGYDPEKGSVIEWNDLQERVIAPATIRYLRSGGLLNMKIGNRLRRISHLL